MPILQSEDNLKNLFTNFPIMVENGNEIDFLSYQFIAIIKNEKEAKKYVKKNFNDLIPFSWSVWSSEMINNVPVGKTKIHFSIGTLFESPNELKMMEKTIAEEYVCTGDEVYAIHFVVGLIKHIHYVFINPNTHKVLLKGNLFGLEVPTTTAPDL